MSNSRSHTPAATHPDAAENDTAVSTILDAECLRRLRDLDPTGENRVMERVMEAFESSLSRLLAQAETAHLQDDPDAIRHVAHTLKSSSASIGALELSRRCADIEAQLREQRPADLARHISGLRAEGQRVLVAVHAAMAG